MKDIKVFNTVEEVYEILGKKAPAKYWDDPFYDSLWDAGFNFDDWDAGFACKEPLHHKVKGDGGNTWVEWDSDVDWLGQQMENYCVGYCHVEYGGYHWYTVHHA